MHIRQMDAEALDRVPQIIEAAARSTLGIVALLVLVLGVLAYALFRASSERARLAVFSGLLAGAVLFGYAAFTVTPDVLVGGSSGASDSAALEAIIWRVDGDVKGQVVAAQRFMAADAKRHMQDSLAHSAASWVLSEVSPEPSSGQAQSLQVIVTVPANLREGISVSTAPAVPFTVSTWDVRSAGKVRLPVSGQDMGARSEAFTLEVDIPTHGTHAFQVTPGVAMTDTLTVLEGQGVIRIGVEPFQGNGDFGAILTRVLMDSPGISVVSPESLEHRRELLQLQRAEIAADPMAQTAIRSSLGVDYIIGGSARR